MTGPGKPEVGELTPVAIREVWPEEDRSFTPWLCSNIDKLGAELGRVLTSGEPRSEFPVGRFRLDILAADEDGVPVLIENQFGESDHKHLGQLMTYASAEVESSTEARTLVWIAERFRQEHLSAVNWLNERTGPETNAFAVEIQAFRIGESLPAPHLRVVARPNDWRKATAEIARNRTGFGSLYRDFWLACKEYISPRSKLLRPGTPKAQGWLSLGRPADGFKLAMTAAIREKYVGCELAYHGPQTARVLHLLEERKSEIEAVYGSSLRLAESEGRWTKLEDRYEGADISSLEKWTEYQKWLLDRSERLLRSVETYVSQMELE